MFLTRSCLVAALTLLSTGLTQAQSDYWDVIVIGGGSTGTYSAVRLQQQGLNVAVIEKKNRLGGHVDTYKAPNSNATFDYGVQLFTNSSIVLDYFDHFDIPLVSVDLQSTMSSRLNVNFKTGAEVNNSLLLSADPVKLGTGLLGYKAEIAKHPEIVPSWNLSYPVDEDLLLPLGDFLVQKNLTAAASTIFSFAGGCGNILAQTTIYIMKYFTGLQVDAAISNGFLANGLSNNQELYNRALAELGESVFLNADVTQIVRSSSGVEVHISTDTGLKLLKAHKLLITIPPKLENLYFLQLDVNELSIFGQFNNSYYWDAMVMNTGIPDNASLNNFDLSAPLQIPAMPALYNLNAVPIPGLHSAYYGSATYISDREVKRNIAATLDAIRKGLGYPAPAGALEFVGFNAHNPFELTVSPDAIRGGFYRKLYDLQGQKDTWYTGAAFQNQASGELWEFTEKYVLPGLVKSLGITKGLTPLSSFKSYTTALKNATGAEPCD